MRVRINLGVHFVHVSEQSRVGGLGIARIPLEKMGNMLEVLKEMMGGNRAGIRIRRLQKTGIIEPLEHHCFEQHSGLQQ